MPFGSSCYIRTSRFFTGIFIVYLALFFSPVAYSADSLKKFAIDADNQLKDTVYVWKSQLLLEQSKLDEAFWKRFHLHGIDRLLLSLDGKQINNLVMAEYRLNLLTFLRQAAQRGIRVELLLGEPLWILPAYRQDLLKIIGQLDGFPFTGLHLDLEPNQLDQARYDDKYLLVQLLHSLQAVTEISPWPVGLSLHPRYLDTQKNGLCLGCALSNLKINEILLMIYVSNPKRVAELGLPIMERFPNISFSIAQSVEPILSKVESYATQGRKKFKTQMEKLREFLRPMDNFSTIAIQSWTDYNRLRP